MSFITITIPHVDGLTEGTETVNDVPEDMNHLLSDALLLTRQQVEEILTAHKPDFVFHDFAFWIYRKLPRSMGLNPFASLWFQQHPWLQVSTDGYPSSTVVFHPEEIMAIFTASNLATMNLLHERLKISMRDSDVLAIRTCREVEGKFCDYIKAHYRKPLLLTGHVLPEQAETVQLEQRWANWLQGFEPGSVLYCAFGSQFVLDKDQFQELVLGFELTGLPFFIAVKQPVGCADVEEALPEGFEERVKGRGVVHGGWVQQTLFLNHPSVGCFVGNCGFGSMWEALLSDNQIVLVPYLADQIINTRLLSTELKVAVEVKREPNRWFSKESLNEAIKSVMHKDSEVGILLKNHDKLRKVLIEPGFSSGYIDKFVHCLEELKNQK